MLQLHTSRAGLPQRRRLRCFARVESIDKTAKTVHCQQHGKIAGYVEAVPATYALDDETLISKLRPGDDIKATQSAKVSIGCDIKSASLTGLLHSVPCRRSSWKNRSARVFCHSGGRVRLGTAFARNALLSRRGCRSSGFCSEPVYSLIVPVQRAPTEILLFSVAD